MCGLRDTREGEYLAIANLKPVQPGSVVIRGSVVEVEVSISDASGASFLEATPEANRVDVAATALTIGLHALEAADTTVTERLLEEKLKAAIEQLGLVAADTLDRASAAFDATWTKKIDEDLQLRLEAHKAAMEQRFRLLFEPGNDQSVQKSIARLLDDYELRVKQELAAGQTIIRRELTSALRGTGDPDHPITKMQNELVKLREDIAKELEASRAVIAGASALDKRPQAGHDYEGTVHGVIADLLKGSDDEVERLGRRLGATGGADGDIVISVDPKATKGKPVRVAVEVTKEAGLSLGKLKKMLEKAATDRGAARSIIVLKSSAALGDQRLAILEGLGAVAVYDPDDPVDFATLPLQVAIRHTRATAVQASAPTATPRDNQAITEEISKAKSALDAMEAIVGNQTKVANLAEATIAAARKLALTVVQCLDRIDEAIAS
jgi:hypothetical protein